MSDSELAFTACFNAGLIVDIRLSWARTSNIDGFVENVTDVKCAAFSAIFARVGGKQIEMDFENFRLGCQGHSNLNNTAPSIGTFARLAGE